MKSVPIPPFTMHNLQGAIGDVIRASYSAGMADDGEQGSMAHMETVIQCAAQLLALVLQREPTPEEVSACAGV